MSKVIKLVKIPVIVFLILVALLGIYYILLLFKILPAPNFMAHIPLLGEYVTASTVHETTELDKMIDQNMDLNKVIKQKNEEIDNLQHKHKDVQIKLKKSEQNELKLKEEIARLNAEMLEMKTTSGSKEFAYKDMAVYFAEMNSQDAADIMGKLNDEDIIGILDVMENDLAAEIMQKMDRDKAVNITKKMLTVAP
ncbi:MAG: hypothetical protein PHT79_00465 [Syntrophomonadaceae bacterium]|nr:hypothetical protein [Syntrophomonadaceae bacterium]